MQQLRRPGPEGTMNCAYCTAPAVQEQSRRTSLGYRVFRCSACQRTFNERTGSPFNFLEFPTDLVLQGEGALVLPLPKPSIATATWSTCCSARDETGERPSAS